MKSKKQIDDYLVSQGEYYNFNELISLKDSLDFIDFNHLNQDGVNIFNEAFIEKVLKKSKQ